MKNLALLVALVCSLSCSLGISQDTNIIGGQTSVLLDTELLSMAAGLNLSGVSDDVIAPGNLGAASVAFDINPRNDGTAPTTFAYSAGGFAPFAGTIEHAGSVFFNDGSIEVGDFSIAFDATRAVGDNSGFFVASTTGIAAILFDIGFVTELTPTNSALTLEASLLVSPEFASFLGDVGLTGADVGDARVDGIASAIPEPTVLMTLPLLALTLIRRKRSS